MSLPYNTEEEREYRVDVSKLKGGKLNLWFESNCGKHKTFEPVDEFDLTPKQLLDILQKHFTQ